MEVSGWLYVPNRFIAREKDHVNCQTRGSVIPREQSGHSGEEKNISSGNQTPDVQP
jgi:hypothetical protein